MKVDSKTTYTLHVLCGQNICANLKENLMKLLFWIANNLFVRISITCNFIEKSGSSEQG